MCSYYLYVLNIQGYLLINQIFNGISLTQEKGSGKEEGGGQSDTKSSYTAAQIKLILTFFTYSLFSVVGYVLYSVVLNRQGAYSTELERYYDCESTGVSPGKVCSRHAFENRDPSKFSLTTTTVLLAGWPFATLIYVTNFEWIIKNLKQKCNKK